MSNLKKIIVSLPEPLLEQTDHVLAEEHKNRSELIREALVLYLSERRKKGIREQMERGYLEMGEINLTLSEEGLDSDLADLVQYEAKWKRE